MRLIANNSKFVRYGFNNHICINQTINGWLPNRHILMSPRCDIENKRFYKRKDNKYGYGKYFLMVLKELGL